MTVFYECVFHLRFGGAEFDPDALGTSVCNNFILPSANFILRYLRLILPSVRVGVSHRGTARHLRLLIVLICYDPLVYRSGTDAPLFAPEILSVSFHPRWPRQFTRIISFFVVRFHVHRSECGSILALSRSESNQERYGSVPRYHQWFRQQDKPKMGQMRSPNRATICRNGVGWEK